NFENIDYVPRWLVFWFDIQIAGIVLVIIGFITNDFSFLFLNRYFLPEFLVALATTSLCFIFFKTYIGVIRHSSYIDAIKLFLASCSSALMLFLVNLLIFELKGIHIYEESIFLILFALGLFVGLFLLRAFVKQLYSSLLVQNHNYEKVFILGVSQNSISVAVAIENEFPKKFKVLGFLDNGYNVVNKQIFGMPILALNRKAHVLIRAHKGVGLIVLENDLKNGENLKQIEDCIEHNLKIYRAPSISEFDINEGINKSIQNIQIE